MSQLISVGIDIAKEKFDVAFLCKESSSKVETFKNNHQGINEFIERLKKQRTAPTVPCVLESTGQYHLPVAFMVSRAGFSVNCINPIITKKYQRASIRNAKTDSIDSLRLAQIGLSEFNLPIFSANIKSIEVKKLISYLGKIENIIQQLKASTNKTKAMKTDMSIDIDTGCANNAIIELKKQTDILKKRICELSPESAELAGKTRGLSHEKVAIVLAALGDKSFSSRDQLVAFVGLDVMPRQSGKWNGKGRLSKRGSSHLRKVLYQIAWGLKQNNPVYQEYYKKLRGKKNYTTAMIILARKFLRFLYSYYWKNGGCPQMSIDQTL